MSLKSPRLLVALVLVALAVVGPMVAAERSAAHMAAAATAFLDRLSSAQRAEATFEIQWCKGHPLPRHLAPRVTTEIDAWGNERRS